MRGSGADIRASAPSAERVSSGGASLWSALRTMSSHQNMMSAVVHGVAVRPVQAGAEVEGPLGRVVVGLPALHQTRAHVEAVVQPAQQRVPVEVLLVRRTGRVGGGQAEVPAVLPGRQPAVWDDVRVLGDAFLDRRKLPCLDLRGQRGRLTEPRGPGQRFRLRPDLVGSLRGAATTGAARAGAASTPGTAGREAQDAGRRGRREERTPVEPAAAGPVDPAVRARATRWPAVVCWCALASGHACAG